jgi:hypothetical protein
LGLLNVIPEYAAKDFQFSVRTSGHGFCDGCIQIRLDLKWRQQVQSVTMTLAVTPLFDRTQGECHQCQESKQVTSALKQADMPANATNARAGSAYRDRSGANRFNLSRMTGLVGALEPDIRQASRGKISRLRLKVRVGPSGSPLLAIPGEVSSKLASLYAKGEQQSQFAQSEPLRIPPKGH